MAELRHELKARHLFTLAFGTIVGVGWITVLGIWVAGGGPLGAIIAFAIGGVLVLAIGLSYAEMAGMMPDAGGEVVYASRTFGPAAGFAAGWILSLIFISVTAFEAISVGWISIVLLPSLEGPVIYELFGAEVSLGSVCIGFFGMCIIVWLNYRGARQAAGFQDLMTYGLIITTLVFVTVGLIRGDPAHLRPFFAAPDLAGSFRGILTVFVMTPFFLAGFNVLPQAVGEISSNVPLRTVGALILWSILGALIFYVLVILASSMTLPREELLEFDLPAAGAFQAAFDSVALGNLVLFAGLLGLVTTWNAVFFAGVRVLLALSRLGAVPPQLGLIHPRFGTPSRAVWLVAIVSTFLMLLGRGAIGLIVNTVGTLFALMFLLVTSAVVYLRLREPERERPYTVPGGILVPIIGGIAATGMVVVSLWEHFRSAANIPPEWIVLLTWAVLGVMFWISSSANRSRRAADDTAVP